MNLSGLRQLCRLRLDDLEPEYLWPDGELNAYINQAVDEAHIRSRNLVDSTTPQVTRLVTVAGQSVYPTHPAVFFVDRVFDTGQKKFLLKTGVNEMDWCFGQWPDAVGKPTHFIEDMNHFGSDGRKRRSITLYPAPAEAGELHLTVFRTQLCDLQDDCEPELPEFQHPDLIHWVMHLAYMKRDEDTYNPANVNRYEQAFTEAFGEKQSARLLSYRRKHRPIKVVGQYL